MTTEAGCDAAEGGLRKRPAPDTDDSHAAEADGADKLDVNGDNVEGGGEAARTPDAKRHRNVVEGRVGSRKWQAFGERHTPPSKPPTDPEELKTALRKQIEYYFSDENMQYDQFFQQKIREDPDSWLKMDHILSCWKVKRLNVTSADFVIEAVRGSYLETKTDENGVSWVRSPRSLPPLIESGRPPRKPKRAAKLVDPERVHDAGCLSKAEGCPEEISWEVVKAAVSEKIPEGARIRFVSQITSTGTCYIYSLTFDGDREFFTNGLELDISGCRVNVSLLTDPEECTKVVKSVLPPPVVDQREKILKFLKKSSPNPKKGKKAQKFVLGSTEFESVGHLRRCVKTLLDQTPSGTELDKDKSAYKVVSELLKFHPKGAEKSKGMTGIKVLPFGTSTTKCFHVIREDGIEDFSVMKCFAQLEANPPVKQEQSESSVVDTEELKGCAIKTVGDTAENENTEKAGDTAEDNQNTEKAGDAAENENTEKAGDTAEDNQNTEKAEVIEDVKEQMSNDLLH